MTQGLLLLLFRFDIMIVSDDKTIVKILESGLKFTYSPVKYATLKCKKNLLNNVWEKIVH